MTLDTLRPPPVLPAQAPMNINTTSRPLENSGHLSKSTVEKPVVVMMDATWNAAWWKAAKMLVKLPRILRVMRRTVTPIIPR